MDKNKVPKLDEKAYEKYIKELAGNGDVSVPDIQKKD